MISFFIFLTLVCVQVVTSGTNELSDSNKQNPLIWTILRQLEKVETKVTKLQEKDEKLIERFGCDNNMEKKVADLSNIILHLQSELKDTKKKLSEFAYSLEKKVEQQKISFYSLVKKVEQQNISTGPTYIRWGKKTCGFNTETVYSGQVGGNSHNHQGGSVNYVCLPNDPDYATALPSANAYSFLYGGEYEVYDYNRPSQMRNGLGNHDVPCALSNVKGRTTFIMIPGRRRCYSGWKKEYTGYLMAGYQYHAAASEYACVDKAAETMPGGSMNQNGVLFYPVKTVCGSLKCPPYKDGTEVHCVVCSK